MPIYIKHACIICEYLLNHKIINSSEYEKICGSICFEPNSSSDYNNAIAKHIVQFCENLKNQNISFNAGATNLSKFGILEVGTLLQENSLKALQFAFGYQKRSFPFAKINIFFDRDMYFLIEPELFSNLHDKGYIFSVEYHLSQIYQFVKNLLPSIEFPKKITVKFPQPNHATLYKDFFNCDIIFNSDENRIFFGISRSKLTKKLEPLNYSEIEKRIINFLDLPSVPTKPSSELKNKIYFILNQSGNTFPDELMIANQLNMHPRTLRRKLKIEGESFRKIISDYKMYQAIKLLTMTDLNYKQIAFQLGFKTSTSFSKAFKNWTSYSPQHYRSNNFP